jgi:hypothetical protein
MSSMEAIRGSGYDHTELCPLFWFLSVWCVFQTGRLAHRVRDKLRDKSVIDKTTGIYLTLWVFMFVYLVYIRTYSNEEAW